MLANFTPVGRLRIAATICGWILGLSWLCVGSTTAWAQASASKAPANKAQTPAPGATTAASDNPRQQPSARNRVIVEERLSRDTAKSKGELTFDDIKFDIEKDGKFSRDMLTEEIEELNKKTVRIRGYILPASVFRQSGIDEFVLVRDNMECCFGPGAALYDCIIVQMEPGKTTEFSTRPIAVRGKFEIKEFLYPDSDTHYAIYKMTASEAK